MAGSGLYARRRAGKPLVLSDWPVDRPRDWTAIVNEAMIAEALAGLRTSVNRSRPWGEAAQAERTAKRLGLAVTLKTSASPQSGSKMSDVSSRFFPWLRRATDRAVGAVVCTAGDSPPRRASRFAGAFQVLA